MLAGEPRRRLSAALAGADLERRIGLDLSVAGLRPPLHLPLAAGLAQGPGFPNLSCLGLLSDRILRTYVRQEEPAATATGSRERVSDDRGGVGERRLRAARGGTADHGGRASG